MTSIPEPEPSGFRIDMLWNDARYRSSFLQIVALVLLMLGVGWLLNNTIQNLEALGQDFNFNFLFSTASYDINQKLISYDSTDDHWRAAAVGMLNTLLVAFMGCVACTVIGVIAGVLRLSKNWVISGLMAVYIELVRNVPLLLQILLCYAIFIETLPNPRAFRGDEPVATLWFDAIAATNRGFYMPRPVFEQGSMLLGLVFLLSIGLLIGWSKLQKAYQARSGRELPLVGEGLAVLAAGVFGLGLGYALFPAAGQGTFEMLAWGAAALSLGGGLAWLFFTLRGLSLKLGILFLPTVAAYFYLGEPISWIMPELRGFNFVGGEDGAIHARNSLMALWLALSIYTGAFVAEIVRGGIQAVSKGQTEAAAALGLRPNRIMSLVILPQALRIIIPPQISQYLNLTKNSSLAIAVGYMDVTGTLGGITLNQTGRALECILLLMAFYLTISLSISAVINWYNERVKLKER
ncbi:MAG: amino acid ABC transporter permease [Paracoccaceae bacterium]